MQIFANVSVVNYLFSSVSHLVSRWCIDVRRRIYLCRSIITGAPLVESTPADYIRHVWCGRLVNHEYQCKI